jgi:hypothetical protein
MLAHMTMTMPTLTHMTMTMPTLTHMTMSMNPTQMKALA